MKIKFTDTIGIDKQYYVVPAIKEIPEWYKKTNSYYGDGKFKVVNGNSNQTIKKCMPVFDAISAGYIIKTYVDIFVSQQNGSTLFQWPYFGRPIEFHSPNQAENHPINNDGPIPKWENPWKIETKSGYSCLFISPMHRDNSIFTIFPGVVDTDKFGLPVSFPFVLNDKSWEGLIPAGTPLAQVIPFKRDSFEMEISTKVDEKERNRLLTKINSTWNNSYKNNFWTKKQYN